MCNGFIWILHIPINVTDKEEPYFNQTASRLTETAVPGTAVVLSCEVQNLGRYKVCTLRKLAHAIYSDF